METASHTPEAILTEKIQVKDRIKLASTGKKVAAKSIKSDGMAGLPEIGGSALPLVPVNTVMAAAPANTPGAPNAALKEKYDPAEEYRPNHPAAAHLVVLDAEKGVIGPAPGTQLRRKIAICGFASSTRGYIPINDPTWEVWAVNQLYRHLPRVDRNFDIHYNWDKEAVPGTDERAWARTCGVPFYHIAVEPDVPTSVRYPIDAIIKHFDADYFTSTIAYMVALATWEIEQRVKAELHAFQQKLTVQQLRDMDMVTTMRKMFATYAIALFGIDLTVGSEYFYEKPCAEYWIGQASALGICVGIPKESALCKQQYRYGYERTPDSLIKLKDVTEQHDLLTTNRNEMLKRLYMFEGALELNERYKQTIELRERGSVV